MVAVAAAMLGVSAYAPQRAIGQSLDDPSVVQIREALGGQLQPLPTTRLRWYLKDLERAQTSADTGYIQTAGQLYRAMRRDGVLAGLLGTRTAGLVRLPKNFYGSNPEITKALQSKNGSRSVFDEMFPPSELALLAADGIVLGVGVAELRPVRGRDYPVMVRIDPEYLVYVWSKDTWFYRSVAGLLPITPGDGRWILHAPGGRMQPWQFGLWPALGKSFINKDHALLHRSNYSAKLANPARVAYAPQAATQEQRNSFLRKLMAWGTNTVFALPPGYEIKLLESNGAAAFAIFQQEIDTSDREYMVAIAGQEVTTTGGSGFSSENLYRTIREDIIQADGESLAYTINTQGIPWFAQSRWGYSALAAGTCVEWNTSKPKDRLVEAQILQTVGPALDALRESLAKVGLVLDDRQLLARFAIPLVDAANDNIAAEFEKNPVALDEAA